MEFTLALEFTFSSQLIHLTMAEADLDHPALEKVPFYEARLIHRKDIHTASVHSTGQLYIPFQVVLPQLSVFLFLYYRKYSIINISKDMREEVKCQVHTVHYV